jgi:hypothetical protein
MWYVDAVFAAVYCILGVVFVVVCALGIYRTIKRFGKPKMWREDV